MKRRDFSLALAASASAAVVSRVHAQGKKPEDGSDYISLDKRLPVEAPAGKIEVIEFFWYDCPHCNAFEPKLQAWLRNLPKDVFFKRVPVAFRDDFVPQQRLYYTLEAMGKLDELHAKVFYAHHVEHKTVNTEATIAAWIATQGVDRAKFLELYNSFSVSTKARKATQLMQAFKVEGVPALGIAGRYYTDGSLAQSMERALQVTDYLVAELRKTGT
jgi:thiol:disulfide interchange protein DsbA